MFEKRTIRQIFAPSRAARMPAIAAVIVVGAVIHAFPVAAGVDAGGAVANSERAGSPGVKALIIDGQNNHQWAKTTPVLKEILESSGLFHVEVATAPPKGQPMDGFKPVFKKHDVIVMNYNGDDWPADTQKAFVDYMRGGGGLVIFHAANNSFPDWKEYNEMIGVGGWGGRNEKSGPMIRFRDGRIVRDETPGKAGTHGPQHEYQVTIVNRQHPITRGLPEKWMHPADELYSKLRGPAQSLTLLATAWADPKLPNGTGENEPMLFTIEFGKGRVFHDVLGHGPEQMRDVGFIVTLQRGTEWAASGKVTQTAIPADFPTADKVSLRAVESAMGPADPPAGASKPAAEPGKKREGRRTKKQAAEQSTDGAASAAAKPPAKEAKSGGRKAAQASSAAVIATPEPYQGDPYADFASYRVDGSQRALDAIEAEMRKAPPDQCVAIEKRLLQILSSPKATADARRAVCRLLRQIGGAASVPALAKLLTDKDLSHIARFALQGMACPEAGAALREALGKVDGDLKIGVIGSLGARRDRQAVPILAALVTSKEPAMTRAAIAALGRIGGAEAARALETGPASADLDALRADARLMCADSMLASPEGVLASQEAMPAEGNTPGAAAIYRSMTDKKQTAPIRVAAYRGLVRADKSNAAQTVVAMFHDGSPFIRRAAATLVADVPGEAATKAFIAELPSLAPETQVALVAALADRGDKAALPGLMKASKSSEAAVRIAALQALGALGGASCVRVLASAAAGADEAGKAAQDSLVRLRGADVNPAMVEIITGKDDAAMRRRVIEAVKNRGDASAAPALLEAADRDADAGVRQDAIRALGALASAEQLPAMVALVTPGRAEAERNAVADAVGSVASRMDDKDAAAVPVIAALARCDGAVRPDVLAALGRVGGPAALETVRKELKTGDIEARKTALRALAKWSDPTPLDDLLALAQTDADPVCRVLALRGYVALAGLPSDRSAKETVKLYEQAMTVASSAGDKRLALSGLAKVPSADALRAVEPYLNDNDLKSEAAAAQQKITKLLEPKGKKAKGKEAAKAEPASTTKTAKTAGDTQAQPMGKRAASGKAAPAKDFDGVLANATDATIHGENARYEAGANRECIGSWSDIDTWVSWEAQIDKPGAYAVEVATAKKGAGGATYVVECAGQKLQGMVKNTGDWWKFETARIGEIRIDKPGRYTLSLKPRQKPDKFLMNLRSVALKRM